MDSDDNGSNVHRDVDWMTPADPSILKFLNSARTARGDFAIQTPNTIALNTGYSNRHTSARCQELAEHDLVVRVDRGQYRLTDRGAALLEGDLSLDKV